MLVLWCFAICALYAVIPQPRPSKTYSPHGPLHTATLVLVPLGAWHAAKHGGHPVIYLLYGAVSALWYAVNHGATLTFGLEYSDARFALGCAFCTGLPVAMGLVCRTVAQRRQWLRIHRARRMGLCTCCDYDLTGNVSGRCPECGREIEGEFSSKS